MEGQEKTVRGIKTFLKTLVTVVLFIIYMFPFYMIVLNAFKHKRDIIKMPLSWGGKKGFTTDNFVDAFQQMNFMNILKNSLIITCVSVFLIILFSSMAAYIFVRKAWKINQIIFMVMLFSMVIPFQVVMIPLISIYGGTFGILNHRATLIFMHLGFSVSMAVFMFHGFIKGGVPISLEEAAQIDGASPLDIYLKIIIPLSKAPLVTVAIFTFTSCWNDFMGPLIYLSSEEKYTAALGLRSFIGMYTGQWHYLMAASTVLVIPVIILFAFCQKIFINGINLSGGLKG